MPFKSESQRKWMHATHPDMAQKWENETPKKAKLPKKVNQVPFGKETEDYYDDLNKHQMRMVNLEQRRNPKVEGMSRNEIAYKLYPNVSSQGPKATNESPFLKAFEDAAAHNSQNEIKNTFHITYKKLNGRTVKRKVDPGTIRNGLMIAYDHKRKAIRSFKLDRVKDMNKIASFIEGFSKAAGLTDHITHGAELAGLGILAAPSAKAMITGKKMSDKNTHRAEIAGLGVLAAPSVAHFASGFMNKAKKAI